MEVNPVGIIPAERPIVGFCQKMRQLAGTAQTIHAVAIKVAQKPVSAVAAVSTLAIGAQQIYAHNFIVGGGLVGTGIWQLYELLRDQGEDADRLQQLLASAEEGVGMVQTLEDGNKKSLAVVAENLTSIDGHIATFQGILKDIEGIATEQSEEIETKKKEAKQEAEQALEFFRQAKAKFEASQAKIKKAHEILERSKEHFGSIFTAAKDETRQPVERLESIVKSAQAISLNSSGIEAVLANQEKAHKEGMDLLTQAFEKQGAVITKHQETLGAVQAHLSQQKLLAGQANLKECEEKLQGAKVQVEMIKQRSNIISELLTQVKSDLAEAQRIEQYSLKDMLVGGGIGYVIGAITLGPVAGFLGLIAGTVLYRKRKSLYAGIVKVCTFLFGRKEEKKEEKEKVPMKYEFDERSSSFWRRYIEKKPSRTVGTLEINLGNESFSFRFNLKGEEKLARTDTLSFLSKMLEMVENDEITKKECREVLEKLKSTKLISYDRAERGTGFLPETELIKQINTYMAE